MNSDVMSRVVAPGSWPENIAGMKNVQQSVLRDIQRNRKFMKNYNVVKNLINNPRCPLDLSLTMVKNLQVNDLKSLSMNKNVPETLKKVALKNFKATGLDDIIDSRLVDALQEIPRLTGPFDMVFIDAWKPDYIKYLNLVLAKVR